MSFVYPQFLWALSALAIPILIHLFNFRKTVRVYFSNTRLLKQVKQETTQKRKIKRYLVLASRLLFLFFLVIAFAQPFLPAHEQMNTGKDITIYLDNSFSMSAESEEKVRALDAGIGYVNQIVNIFPPDARFKLVTNDFAPFSNSFKTRPELVDLLTQIRLAPVSRPASEILKRIIEPNAQDIFWISDFQKSTLGKSPALHTDSTRSWHLIPIATGKLSNIFVDSVHLDNPFVVGGEKNLVNVRLRNSGKRKVDGMVVKLSINGVQSATASATLEGSGFTDVSFDITSLPRRFNQAKITFNDFPVSFDNEFYFTVNFSEKINVVEIRKAAGASYVGLVYGNSKLFDFRTFQSTNVNYSLINNADLVVLNGLDAIDPALSSALSSYRARSGTLLFIPGEHPDVVSLKGTLPTPVLNVNSSAEWMELDKPDFQNPFFENVFEARSTDLSMPRAKRLLDWGTDRSAVLRFRDGQPFLSHNRKVFMLASPLSKEYSDFFSHALFVPVMYRIAASGKRHENKAYYTLRDNLIQVSADSLLGEDPVRLTGAQEIIPSQRRVGDRLSLDVPQFEVSAGFYNVMNGKDTLDLIAFNLDKDESLLDQYTGNEVRQFFSGLRNVSLFEDASPQAFTNEIKERYLGTPLWKQALILALVFLLAEVLLIRFLK